jgi:hypothetical protein
VTSHERQADCIYSFVRHFSKLGITIMNQIFVFVFIRKASCSCCEIQRPVGYSVTCGARFFGGHGRSQEAIQHAEADCLNGKEIHRYDGLRAGIKCDLI